MSQEQNTLVSREEIPEWAQFQVSLTQHPIIKDKQGVLRYQANPLVVWLMEHIDLNDMWRYYRKGLWSCEAFMQFYRDIGYSLGGFEEIWCEELDEAQSAAPD